MLPKKRLDYLLTLLGRLEQQHTFSDPGRHFYPRLYPMFEAEQMEPIICFASSLFSTLNLLAKHVLLASSRTGLPMPTLDNTHQTSNTKRNTAKS